MLVYTGPEELISLIIQDNVYLYNQYTKILNINGNLIVLEIDNTKNLIEVKEIDELSYYKEIYDFEEIKELVSRYYLIDYSSLQCNLKNLNMLINLAYDAGILEL